MHGPPHPEYGWAPRYSNPIHVVDSVVETVTRQRNQRKWRRWRDEAFAQWQLPFKIMEGAGILHDYADPLDLYATYVTPFAIPATIRLVRNVAPKQVDGLRRTSFGVYLPGSDAGIVAVLLTQEAWSTGTVLGNPVPYIICHEIGHCLGLTHGGAGVMMGRDEPNAHDLESVRSWYGR